MVFWVAEQEFNISFSKFKMADPILRMQIWERDKNSSKWSENFYSKVFWVADHEFVANKTIFKGLFVY